ncbi:MAG: proteasome accessory factor PafA2 family protein, partial [Planctomycetes bacterium]|nr:proteasome accessory factor PafA2 family protein [Planctomycetota bacterium]
GNEEIQRLRDELCEIDIRYGELGSRGLRPSLLAAGFETRLEAGRIERAMIEPPAGGRAEFRGRFIRDHADEADRYRVDWTRISDLDESRWLPMRNPERSAFEWKSTEAPGSIRQLGLF